METHGHSAAVRIWLIDRNGCRHDLSHAGHDLIRAANETTIPVGPAVLHVEVDGADSATDGMVMERLGHGRYCFRADGSILHQTTAPLEERWRGDRNPTAGRFAGPPDERD